MANFSNTSRPAYVWDGVNNQWVPVGVGPHTHSVADVANAVSNLGGSNIVNTTATSVPLTLTGAVSQTADLFDVKNSAGTVVANIDANGNFAAQNANYAGKNFIINGGMDIWQRGTTFTDSSGPMYTADRWQTFTTGSATVTQQSLTVPSNFRYAIQVTANTNSIVTHNYQIIETANVIPLAGKVVTLSAYVTGTAGKLVDIGVTSSNTVDDSLYNIGTGVGGQSTTIVSAGTFQKITATMTIPSNAKTLRIGLESPTMNNGEYLIWSGVQFEIGSVATPFSRAGGTLQGELALCQRYYYTPIYGNPTLTGSTFGPISQNAQNINGFAGLQFPVSMRTAPTLTLYSNGTANYVRQTSNGAQNYLGASPTVYVLNNNGYAAIISASASLTTGVMYDWTYTVSAEL